MTLKIVGAGFGRTGTLSMKAALEMLGFGPCYHMAEVIQHPEFAEHWIAAAAGKAVDWDVVFKGYLSSVDWPACAFYKSQAAHFPDAKVILTVRDMASWYESCMATIFGMMLLDPANAPPAFQAPAKVGRAVVSQMTFGGRLTDREHCIAVHQAHIDEVKRSIAPDRLLVYEVKQGWEPLCAFLGVAVPNAPFPKVNSRDEFMAGVAARRAH